MKHTKTVAAKTLLLSLNKKFKTFRDRKALKTGHFRSLRFWCGSILVLLLGRMVQFLHERILFCKSIVIIKKSEGKVTLCIDILDYRLFWNFPIFSFFISLDFTRANDSISLCTSDF